MPNARVSMHAGGNVHRQAGGVAGPLAPIAACGRMPLSLIGVAEQSAKYALGLPAGVQAWRERLLSSPRRLA